MDEPTDPTKRLFEVHGDEIRRYITTKLSAYKCSDPRTHSIEVSHKVFLKLNKYQIEFLNDGQFNPYAKKVCKNASIDHMNEECSWNKDIKQTASLDDDPEEGRSQEEPESLGLSPEDELYRREQEKLRYQLIEKLLIHPKLRKEEIELLKLFYFGDENGQKLLHKEIGMRLGISEGYSRVRLDRILNKISKLIDEDKDLKKLKSLLKGTFGG